MKRYRLYIDESGDHTYTDLQDQNKRYLCLLGVFVEVETYRSSFYPALEKLKQEHFPHSPDEPVILHRKELANRSGPFGRLKNKENEQRFNSAFLGFLSQQDFRLIAVVIDKKMHVERYGDAAFHPYHYCLAAVLERYCGFLNLYNARGDVMAESRGGKEDIQLKEAYKRLLGVGTYFRQPEFFRNVLTSMEIKLKPKSANIAGLQIADLLAHPVKQEILLERGQISSHGSPFGAAICQTVAFKYNRRVYDGRIQGYGKVFLG